MKAQLLIVTLCLGTLVQSEDVEDLEDGGDLLSTYEDYDEYGELIIHSTKKSMTTDDDALNPGTERNPDLEDGVEVEATLTSHSVLTSTKDVQIKRIPGIDEDENCGDPPSVEHARIERGRKSRYSEGDVIFYSCEFGYVSHGSERTSQCILSERTNTLEWRPPETICIPMSCGDPGFVANAHRVGSLFTFPNRVSFECDEGYVLRGNGVRYCKTSGTWSGTLPTCEKIFCDPPTHPVNGRVSFASLEFGSELSYECENGFVLRKFQSRICSANGTWSGDEPQCQDAQCEPPVAPDHGSVQVVGGKSSVNSMALYTCHGGRILVGSATSKCLNIGQWTFPTPKCVEPCAVPKVSHGTIGKYEIGRYRQKTFKNLAEGTKIEDGAELYLTCENKYEPMGTTDMEVKIVCNLGEWNEIPRCEPASCRTPPPPTKNARQATGDTSHGAGVIYHCNQYFKKTAYGNVKCQFGTWVGGTPTCTDTRCDAESLAFPGVKKDQNKRYYLVGQSFKPTCEKGYTAATADNKLTCQADRQWTGHLPACVPASCLNAPPAIENGEIESFSTLHTSTLAYKCDDFFQLRNVASKVRCNFGGWVGTPPVCHDSRCYVENLRKKEGISVNTERVTYSGDSLQVFCNEGFTSTGIEPTCSEGKWTEKSAPCKENDCSVYNINQGKFTEKVRKQKCNYFGLNCNVRHEFEEVNRNRKLSAGSSLYVTCDAKHSFQGRDENNVRVTCSEGKWLPRPVCLRTGIPYREEVAPTPSYERAIGTKQVTRATTARPTTDQPSQPSPATSQPEVARVVSGRHANCTCTYINSDPNLVATAGTEYLRNGTLIRNLCKVRFYCRHLGYHQFQGPKEITCEMCRTWHSSEYPECRPPVTGDTTIQVESDERKELPGGVLALTPGSRVRITCIPNGVPNYPDWRSIPNEENIRVYSNVRYNQGYTFYLLILEIENISPINNGKYECGIKGYRSNAIEIQVMVPEVVCPTFSENYFRVHYDKGQAVNSSAMFSCKNPNERIVGSAVMTCLSNGQWSGDPPQCITSCPELRETEGMKITYTLGLETDSTATFHCFAPRMRKGVAYTKCKKKGEWADPVPSCDLPSCPLDSLFRVVPENVVPLMDGVTGHTLPFDFTLSLTCDNNLRLIGAAQTAKCGRGGEWEVSKVQCVTGCPRVEKLEDFDLLVEPDEEFYRIGQFVTFSCAQGQVLSSEVVRIMCLNEGWSETEIPRCQAPPDDEVEATEDVKED